MFDIRFQDLDTVMFVIRETQHGSDQLHSEMRKCDAINQHRNQVGATKMQLPICRASALEQLAKFSRDRDDAGRPRERGMVGGRLTKRFWTVAV
jgi:hypothetical protein